MSRYVGFIEFPKPMSWLVGQSDKLGSDLFIYFLKILLLLYIH